LGRLTTTPKLKRKNGSARSQSDGYLDSYLDALARQFKQSLSFNSLEKVDRITPADFFRHYFYANRPVVIRGLMRNWKALKLWTPDYFARKFGKYTLEVNSERNRDPLYDRNFTKHNAKMLMKDYVAMIRSGGETNDYYIGANNHLLRRRPFRSLLAQISCPKGFFDPRYFRSDARLFFGPKGTISSLHHDPFNGMLGQVYGRKRIKLIPPFEIKKLYNHLWFSDVDLEKIDYEKFPCMKGVTILETVLEPGEHVFIPIGWWHWVKSLDVSISLFSPRFLVPGKPILMQRQKYFR
jgi:Cupin-like domain